MQIFIMTQEYFLQGILLQIHLDLSARGYWS